MKEKSVDERKTNKKTRNFFCFFPTFSDPVKEARHVAERHHRLPLGVHARAEQDQDVEADPRPPDEPDQQQPPEEREGSFLCHWPAFAVVYPVEDGVDDQGDRLRDKGGDGLVEGREPDALDRVVGDAVGLMLDMILDFFFFFERKRLVSSSSSSSSSFPQIIIKKKKKKNTTHG